ncbi:MAG: hypothetical protein AB7N61_17335 [Acidimicrobiia bacterium]
MTDRIESFIEEFEQMLALHQQMPNAVAKLADAADAAGRLADRIEWLIVNGVDLVSVSPSSLRGLRDELVLLQSRPRLDTMIKNGEALIQLIDQRFIEGDATRIRDLLSRAGSVSRRVVEQRGGQPEFEGSAQARCADCDSLIAGHHGPTRTWAAITKAVRIHERAQHGDLLPELRDALPLCRHALNSGEAIAEFGRYQIGQLR